MSPAAKARLCAVHDCAIIRAPMGDPGFVELATGRLVVRRYLVGPQGYQCDYMITHLGRETARELFRGRP